MTSAPGRWAVLQVLLAAAALADGDRGLVWHVERPDGTVISTSGGDRAVNPASVIKIATALLTLELLGSEHRYETGFALDGRIDPATGALDGDLVVLGGDDPDFHLENALLVGWRLNELGVRSVAGDLALDDRFWIGWERGSEGRQSDPELRRRQMGDRLRRALDPARWTADERRVWTAWRERDPRLPAAPPAIPVSGGLRLRDAPPPPAAVVHRSNPLRLILKRFLAYSNNDIERLTDALGGAPALERYLEARLALAPEALTLSTASGLGRNRLSPAAGVRLLRAFAEELDRQGLEAGDLMPMPGCDPGSLEHALPTWRDGPGRGATAAKTGTLIREDGGVAALAGFLYGREGTVLYMVAAPASGARIAQARADIEGWLGGVGARLDGLAPRPCGAPVAEVDAAAEAIVPGQAASAP